MSQSWELYLPWGQDFCCCVQHLSHVQLFLTPRTLAHQAPLSSTVSWSLLKFISIESMMLANHLILYCPLFLLPSIFPSIMVFSNEWSLHTECQKSRWGPLAFPLIYPHISGPISLLKCRECFVKHLASPTCLFVILSSGPDQGKSHSAGKFTAS